jgi:hypothetical protein
MRIVAVVIVALLGLFAMPPGSAHARYEGPWCMHMSMGFGMIVSRCHMRSYEMCRAEMRGIPASYCTENPHYTGPVRPARKTQRRQRT